jgi:pantothenate kinase-related protein Tda10
LTQRVCEDIVSGNVRIEQFLPPRSVPNVAYRKFMQSLNVKQRMFVLNVLHRLKTRDEPFYNFLSGGAGVGKSHVVKAIVQLYMLFRADSKRESRSSLRYSGSSNR